MVQPLKKHIANNEDSQSGMLNFNIPKRDRLRVVTPEGDQSTQNLAEDDKLIQAIDESEELVRQMMAGKNFDEMIEEDSFSIAEASAVGRIERQEKKKTGESNPGLSYFKTKNHLELYKMGTQYQIDYESGYKNFAFNSIGEGAVAQATIMGLASFFSYHHGVFSTIVTMDYKQSYFSKILPDLKLRHKAIEGITYKVYEGAGIEVIEYGQLRSILENTRVDIYENFLNTFIYNCEMVLWDFPHQKVMDSQRELFFPLMKRLSNISIIMERSRTKANDLKNLIEYYSRYNVNVKGVMLAAE